MHFHFHFNPRDWDFGGILEGPHNCAASRRGKSLARRPANAPDPVFEVDGLPSHALVVAREANRAWHAALFVHLLVFLSILTIVGVCLAFAALTAAGAEQTVDKLEGTWKATSQISDGKKVPENEVAKLMMAIIFKDGKYRISFQDKANESGTFKIDGLKRPASLDLIIQEGKFKGKTRLGIYKLEGDTLTLAWTTAWTKDRPKSIDGAPEVEVVGFKRKK